MSYILNCVKYWRSRTITDWKPSIRIEPICQRGETSWIGNNQSRDRLVSYIFFTFNIFFSIHVIYVSWICFSAFYVFYILQTVNNQKKLKTRSHNQGLYGSCENWIWPCDVRETTLYCMETIPLAHGCTKWSKWLTESNFWTPYNRKLQPENPRKNRFFCRVHVECTCKRAVTKLTTRTLEGLWASWPSNSPWKTVVSPPNRDCFLRLRECRSALRVGCVICERIGWFLQHWLWWVALQSACTFREVYITPPFPNHGHRPSRRNFKDISRWVVAFEALSVFDFDLGSVK